jgi:hypothetical protein
MHYRCWSVHGDTTGRLTLKPRVPERFEGPATSKDRGRIHPGASPGSVPGEGKRVHTSGLGPYKTVHHDIAA